jgi:hypothetical protein
VALLILCTTGCSEIYYPKVTSGNDFLVVDGCITNSNGPFVIKLSKAVKYSADSVTTPDPVSQASLTITDNNNASYALTETSPGKYTTPSSLVPQVGNSYKLHIKTAEGNIYESDYQKIPKPTSYNNIQSYNVTESFLDSHKSLQTTTGADIRIDLSNSSSAENIKCRFTTNLTVQYMYTSESYTNYCIAYQCFGWETGLSLENNVNITDESNSDSNNSIVNHKVGFVPFALPAYQAAGDLLSVGQLSTLYYYLKINQYTLNDATFAFYKTAKAQLSASGKIFDPIASQLYSNIKCTNNPSKLALGFFEASSVTTAAMFIFERDQKMVSSKVPYIEIPPDSLTQDQFWKCSSQPPFLPHTTPYPGWWGHGIL